MALRRTQIPFHVTEASYDVQGADERFPGIASYARASPRFVFPKRRGRVERKLENLLTKLNLKWPRYRPEQTGRKARVEPKERQHISRVRALGVGMTTVG
jgi:hypothetical protein